MLLAPCVLLLCLLIAIRPRPASGSVRDRPASTPVAAAAGILSRVGPDMCPAHRVIPPLRL